MNASLIYPPFAAEKKYDLVRILKIILGLCLLFAGNGRVGDFYIIFLFSITYFIISFDDFARESKQPLIVASLILVLMSADIYGLYTRETLSEYIEKYRYWPLFYCATLVIFPLFNQLRTATWWEIQAAFLTIAVALIPFAEFENGQLNAIFGPNILYRFAILYFALSSIKLLEIGRKYLIPIPFFLTLLVLLLISSRGGWISLVLVTALLVPRAIKLHFAAWLGLIAVTIFLLLSSGDMLLSLVLSSDYLRVEQYDSSLRGQYVSDFIDLFIGKLTYAGSGINRFIDFYGQYPHNIFLESYLYYGWSMLLITSLIFVSLLFSIFREKYALITIPFIVGVLLSGDFKDNFILFILAAYFSTSGLLSFFNLQSSQTSHFHKISQSLTRNYRG